MNKHYILQAINAEGKSVFIDDVPNGKSCGCYCKECGGELIARQGNIKIHHFAHLSGNDSFKCSQTALHLLAKKIILEEKRIPYISNNNIEFVDVETIEEEKNLGDIKPDLYAIYSNKSVAIEIFVSHAVDDVKYDRIQNHQLTTFEIDLSNIEFETKEDVKKAIYDLRNIRFIYDYDICQSYINRKINFIKEYGRIKPIENGMVRQCNLRPIYINNHFTRWSNVTLDVCKLCSFGIKKENTMLCAGHVNGNLEIWFLRANVNENRFMSSSEAKSRLISFLQKR